MAKDNNNINIADELSSSGSSAAGAGSSSADALKGNSRTTTTDQQSQQQQLSYGRGRTNGVLGSHSDTANSGDLHQQQQQHTSGLGSQRSATSSSNVGPADTETGGMTTIIRYQK